jgi:hypothetical protein
MAAGFSETAFSRMEIWPLISDSDCAPSSGTFTFEVLAGLAGTGQDDLPIVGGGVLDNNRDGRLRIRGEGRLHHPGGGYECQETDKKAPAWGGNKEFHGGNFANASL